MGPNGIRILLSIFLTLALALGCNTGTDEPDAPAGPETASPSETAPTEGTTSKPREAARVEVEGDVPEAYPSDLPLYPGGRAAQGKSASQEGAELSALQLQIDDDRHKAFDYYRAELETSGWTVEDADGDRGAITVIKDGCKVQYLFAETENGGTDVFSISECDNG